ncbi:MAG: hypothetical protein ACOY93_04925 [Bacillota bacterium]
MSAQSLTWWGERWLQWLRALGVGPETDGQAKSALRAEGQVRLERGRVIAAVWVSERRQATPLIKVRPWSEKDWKRVLEAIAAQPDLAQRVLSGTMGPELEQALIARDLRLFPREATLGCNCGVRQVGCRHLNFLVLKTAELLSGNPFLWLEVMGRGRQELLSELKARLADRSEPRAGLRTPAEAEGEGEVALTAPEAGEPLDPERFWETPVDPAAIPVRPGGSAAPDGLLRSLGPLPVEEGLYLLPSREPVRADEFLRRMVVQVGRMATALALGEVEPAYRPLPLPGKPVPPAARLAREVAEALRTEDGMILIDDLYPQCPTAMALGDEEAARRPLREACSLLPGDLITVADRYVGPAAALLRGAAFHHVLTLDEWLDGELHPDGDWALALRAAGREVPSLAPHLRRLQPRVGDELIIRLREGGPEVGLRPRAERRPEERLHADAVASRLLQMVSSLSRSDRLPLPEAVAVLLAEGAYRGDLQPDPVWLIPLLGPGLYLDPAERAVTRQPTSWRPGLPRFIYGHWPGRERTLMDFQGTMTKAWAPRREIEIATACITWWGRVWPGAQDQPAAAESLGTFLHFLWNLAPREAGRYRIPPQLLPTVMARWFTFLSERFPDTAPAYARHLRACSLTDLYEERCQTAPPEGAAEGALLAWQAEAYRWMGPAHYLSGGGYR